MCKTFVDRQEGGVSQCVPQGWNGRHQRTISTGVSQPASTLVATDPITRLPSVPWPREPITIRSNLPFSASVAITSAA